MIFIAIVVLLSSGRCRKLGAPPIGGELGREGKELSLTAIDMRATILHKAILVQSLFWKTSKSHPLPIHNFIYKSIIGPPSIGKEEDFQYYRLHRTFCPITKSTATATWTRPRHQQRPFRSNLPQLPIHKSLGTTLFSIATSISEASHLIQQATHYLTPLACYFLSL